MVFIFRPSNWIGKIAKEIIIAHPCFLIVQWINWLELSFLNIGSCQPYNELITMDNA